MTAAIVEVRRINDVGMMYVPKRFRAELGLERDGSVAVAIELAVDAAGRKCLVMRAVQLPVGPL